MAYVLTVAGTTRTMQAGWSIDETANGRNLFRFSVKSEAGTYRPALDEEVILTESGTRIFGGNITRAEESGLAPPKATSIITAVEASDFNALTDRRLYTTFLLTTPTLKAALQDIVTFIPGATLDAGQVTGPTLPDLIYFARPVRDVLNDLTVLSGGYLWEVDYNKVLRMYLPGTYAAPFSVTEANRNAIGDVLVEPTRDGFANVVLVKNATLQQVAFDAGDIATHGYWEVVYTAPDEALDDALLAMATMILARSLIIRKSVRYHTLGLGVHPGQTQTITFASRNINNTFLVTDVRIRDLQTKNQELDHEVTALEGTTYHTGWQEQWRLMRGTTTTGGGAIAGTGSPTGGSTGTAVYWLGGSAVEAVQTTASAWIPASSIQVSLDTVTLGVTSGTVSVQLRADSGTVTARLRNVSDSTTAGTSSAASGATFGAPITFAVTLTAGTKLYRLELSPSVSNVDIAGMGYVQV
jgi:hypothetical protein